MTVVILQFDLILLKDSQEALKIDSHVLIAPELVHEVVQLFLVDLQLRALEEVSEVVLCNEPSAALVSNLEELSCVFDLAARHSLDKLVDDMFFSRMEFESKSFKFCTELSHADIFAGVDIHSLP